jgi:hypothetical protein
MEFEWFEYEFASGIAEDARRIASRLAEGGYHSLRHDMRDVLQRYVPAGTDGTAADEAPSRARTVDVLVPAADPAARILVCDRPTTGHGHTVAVVALARSHDDAHRARTAAKLALDAGGGAAKAEAGDGGRSGRFRPEWAPALGWAANDIHPAAPGAPRPFASTQALIALQGAPALLGRPSVLRSKLDKSTDTEARGDGRMPPAAVLDALTTDGLVERSFVLMCRETGQIVGVGQDAAEVRAARQLSLRCPHCRHALSDERQDVLYSLSASGEEFIKSARWLRDAVEASLRRRRCDAVLPANGPKSAVDGAACYQDTVLLFCLRDGAPADGDIRSLRQAAHDLTKAAPDVSVRGVVVTAQPQPAPRSPADEDGQVPCAFLHVSAIDDGLDELLEELKRETLARLTGGVLESPRFDPAALVSGPSRVGPNT